VGVFCFVPSPGGSANLPEPTYRKKQIQNLKRKNLSYPHIYFYTNINKETMRYVAFGILIIIVQAIAIHLLTPGEKDFEDAMKGSCILACFESIVVLFILFW